MRKQDNPRRWRKRRAHRRKHETQRNIHARNDKRAGSIPDLPPKQESALIRWVRQGIAMARMKAANSKVETHGRASQQAETSPQKVTQRRGA